MIFTGKFAEVFDALDEPLQELLAEHLYAGTSANFISQEFERVGIKLSPTTIKEQRARLVSATTDSDLS